MPRTNYCLPIDVVRRFEPGVSRSDLENNNYLPEQNQEMITSRIEGVENQFEDDTGTALREVRVGSKSTPSTYEHLEAKRSHNFPTSYTLGHNNVLPLDSSKGDAIEVRTARDNWKDITSDQGLRWVLVDNRRGKLEFYSRLRSTIQFRVRPGVRFIRLTYRYGALGGSATEGGQTTLGESVSGSATPTGVSVADASRLPAEGGTVLLNGQEYVRISNVDPSANTIDIDKRGLRRTDDTLSYSSGDIVHYCPMRVREAIAAKTAEELVRYDSFVDDLLQDNGAITADRKLEDWDQEYTNTVARYSQWHYS